MDELALTFFPFPHVFRGQRRQGALIDWPAICARCDRQCEATRSSELEICSYGLNYLRVNDELIVAGVLVRDYPQSTLARRKRFREVGRDAITRNDLESVLDRCRQATEDQAFEARRRMDEVIADYRNSKGYQQEVLEMLRPDLERTLSQVHDYKQFVQQIVQNMNVIFETRDPGASLDAKLRRASHEEAAVYWAAVIMDEKLDAALFLDEPERILEPREQGRFRLHGLVLKYVRIYKSQADRKQLKVHVNGDSWAQIEGNSRALGIIPHTMIDNAIKYAPNGTRVEIDFEETREDVVLSVSSFGPLIAASERERIFDLFYRGAAAIETSSEGTGFGLASAQNIAKAHDTEITVDQTDRKGRDDTVLTKFSVSFKIVSDSKLDRARQGAGR